MNDELKEGIFKKNSFYGQPRLQIFGENFCGRGLRSGGNNEPIPEGNEDLSLFMKLFPGCEDPAAYVKPLFKSSLAPILVPSICLFIIF